MTEYEIVAKAEKQVKEEYGWEDKVFELFKEPMIEVATAVAVQTTKDLQEENRSLLESCEGATMMYKDLCKAKELLKDITSSYGSTDVSEAQLYLKIKKADLFLIFSYNLKCHELKLNQQFEKSYSR